MFPLFAQSSGATKIKCNRNVTATQETKNHVLSCCRVNSAMGAIELWLWKVGHANEYGLYIGLALGVGAILSAAQYIKSRKQA